MDYDLNGNITSLKRTGGLIGNTAEVMDDLVYHYNDGGNILSYVEKTGSGNALSGYPLAQGSGQLISYDDNGNMTSHPDKGITKMTYNVLNLVSSITSPAASKSIAYVYVSDGTKVKAASDGKVTDYLGGFQYETTLGNLTTQILANEEGYFDFINNRYVYQYRDHLGNIRISYTKSANGGTELLEENNYYPLGLKHTNYNTGSTTNNNYKYLYNGKELQSSGYLDYGWRQYIPELGRWNGMDQLAESYQSFSPYAYVINNPVSLTDPDGRLSQNFINQINNSSGGTMWYNTGIGFSTSGGTSMDYDGNEINWGSSHIGGVLSSIGVTYTGGGMGADIAGFIDIPGITLTGKHNQWGNSFQSAFNSYMNEWNARSDFAWDRSINAGRYNDGPIRYMGSAGDPFGFLEGIGIAMSASGNGRGNFILAALMITRSGNTTGLKMLAAEKGILQAEAIVAKTQFAAEESIISSSDFLRIKNAASRINKPITVVGSRASGTAKAYSDWDYVIEGLNSKEWFKIKNSIPGARSVIDNTARNIDIFKQLNLSRPYLTIHPR